MSKTRRSESHSALYTPNRIADKLLHYHEGAKPLTQDEIDMLEAEAASDDLTGNKFSTAKWILNGHHHSYSPMITVDSPKRSKIDTKINYHELEQ